MTDVCPNCHAGALRLRRVTYAAWHTLEGVPAAQEQFVVVPRVPAWLCDVCGARFFDADAMTWLAPLLGPTADPEDQVRTMFARREHDGSSFDGDLDQGRT